MNIVLIEPEIPQNTGNIGRLCVATGTPLHLVGRLGFKLDDRYLKRAGMDYWKDVELYRYDSFETFKKACPEKARLHLLTTKARRFYTDVSYEAGDYIVFGSESKGLSEEVRNSHMDRCIKIPMVGGARSLNLASSAGIVLYEALRQTNFFNCLPVP